ncbi:cryptochrome/photolyase family protein [Roseibacillus persicicus]|uniref:cryptochrome/photolyase family protein n=1 Tax=Roseibacillus persicicus TaxID=454148 RepID=UPI002810EBCC|nr:cryptochrome/photolyase family protein [Roseibacillus persicicus]
MRKQTLRPYCEVPADLTLIFPHQLFAEHPSLEKKRPVYLLEDPLLYGIDRHQPLPELHPFKAVLHRASLLAFQERLEKEGFEVQLVSLPTSPATTEDQLEKLPLAQLTRIHLAEVSDYLIERRLIRFAKRNDIELVTSPSPNFLSPSEFLEREFPEGKKPFMARFYQHQRQRMDILMEGSEPAGGQYSFDEDNRKKLPKDHPVPEAPTCKPNAFVKEAAKWADNRFGKSDVPRESLPYPVTHRDAEAWLEQFLTERFQEFGPYEDAISTQQRTLFHSVLTPMLNIGLLSPDQVVERALKVGKEKEIPLNSLEGFIRQVIGWREFMKAMYDQKGVEMRNRNFWNFNRSMPQAFYDGTTGIPPVDDAIRHARETGYCHHIERLMVLGNFMLLCRIDPDEVYRWFMELFIDAYDWVMVPNVYGMSQFADGGLFTTKPYLSGSNYICKMSDYKKSKDWAPIWDGLYWTFIDDHLDIFAKNHRLSMMARTCERMSPDKKAEHRQNAESFLQQLK